jgi:hypothetical protein
MLDLDTRKAILRLSREGHGTRVIARALGVSRNAVREVLRTGVAEVPAVVRPSTIDHRLDRVRELFARCEGNLVRVHEILGSEGLSVSYPALTAFCRRHGIGQKPKVPVGQYCFAPGEEMQHDTSPHDVVIGGRKRRVQCASLVLCFSRMIFCQVYPTFNRFWCKVFLTEGVSYFRGAAAKAMIDNTHVIVAYGTGANMVPAPEMAAFAERFGFEFEAHEVGDANRSAHVERQFSHVQKNFYPGRTFVDFDDINRQLVTWCDDKNQSFKRSIRARPIDLFATEAPLLHPLPLHVPEVYEPHERIVDSAGFVNLHTNRYSVPAELISRRVSVHLTKDRARIFSGHRLVCEHGRLEDGQHGRAMLDEHKRERRWHHLQKTEPLPEERTLRTAVPELGVLVDALRKRHGGRAVRAVRRLHRLYVDYPTEPLIRAVTRALDHGLTDLSRIETMVIRSCADNFFRPPSDDSET